jgi:hypothetical protein
MGGSRVNVGHSSSHLLLLHLLLQLHRVLLLPAASISLPMRCTFAKQEASASTPACSLQATMGGSRVNVGHSSSHLLLLHLLLQLHRVLLLPAASVRFVLHSTIKTNI